jgi:hypothetical protein
MSLNFLFNNGIGPGAGGCNGQSLQNCGIDSPGCCSMPAGPVLSSKFRTSQNMSFKPMNSLESIQFVKAQKSNPAMKTQKSNPVKSQVPSNGIGIL